MSAWLVVRGRGLWVEGVREQAEEQPERVSYMGVFTVRRLADASWLGVLVCAALHARPVEPGSGLVRKTWGSQRWGAVIGLVSGGTSVKRVSWNHASTTFAMAAHRARARSQHQRPLHARGRSVCNHARQARSGRPAQCMQQSFSHPHAHCTDRRSEKKHPCVARASF